MIRDRFGVVNPKKRERFEKKFHVAYGYDFVSFDKKEAIAKANKPGLVVEQIHTDYDNVNKTWIIFGCPK